MNYKTITAAEAEAIINGSEDLDNLPFRTLNETGKQAIVAFVTGNARNGANNDMNAWFAEAEQAAGDSLCESVIEISSRLSVTNNPVTLTLPAECFDWLILE